LFDWIHLFLSPAVALAVAYALDRCFGEPPTRWHPVAWMGRYLGAMGGLIAPRSEQPSPNWTAFAAGALAWYGGAMVLVLLAWSVQWWLLKQHPLLAGIALGVLLNPMLAWRMLRDEVAGVEAGLAQSLDAGRRRLGRIVSREVMQLDELQVRESALESLAENFNDSVVAPVFWFVLAGLPGAVLYRFANTADAMWGYRGWRAGSHWEWAGKWAARADDVLSWLPARLSALFVAMAAGGLPLRTLRREAGRTASPNSGWPMAALALALGKRLRKPGSYALHGEAPSPQAADTPRAIALLGVAMLLLAAWALLTLGALKWGRMW
jgi:adenosylcobinamide-phosphate synthase